MDIRYNENKTIKIIFDEFSGREHYEHKCPVCGKFNVEDDIVWINPVTRDASTGEGSEPYCVDCAPEDEYEKWQIDTFLS